MPRPKHAAQRPATFGDVFAVPEYRALYAASALSWAGDYLARAAVTALVFTTTHSVGLSAGSFAIGYLPWLTVGPFLSALAERYSKRTVMVVCDIGRACIIGVVAIPGRPIPVLFVLLFAAALLNPPFDSSRSALLPSILSDDRYVVGMSLQNVTNSVATVFGYFVGGLAGTRFPHVTLLFDALTFLASAILVAVGVKHRPAVRSAAQRSSLMRETAAGFHLVLASPVLRGIVAIFFGVTLLGIVPEGLAAAWAGHFTSHVNGRGLDQALIMMGVPIGLIAGGLFVGRLVPPERRARLIRPLSLAVPLALAAALLDPPVLGVAAVSLVVGFGVGAISVLTNGLFVQALPAAFRTRAFGVVLFGLQLVQVGGLVITGLFSDRYAIHAVVGIFGLCGIGLILATAAIWPAPAAIEAAIAAAKAENAADEIASAPSTSAPNAGVAEPDEPAPSRPAPSRPAGWPSPRPGGRSNHVPESSVGQTSDAAS